MVVLEKPAPKKYRVKCGSCHADFISYPNPYFTCRGCGSSAYGAELICKWHDRINSKKK